MTEQDGTSYGGVWQCGNQALTQALGKYGRRSVFDEWKKNMLGTHAELALISASRPDLML